MANFPALLNGVNPGVVRDLVKKGDITYFCGTFTSVGGVTGYAGLARINSSGQVDQSWKPVAGNAVKYLYVSDDVTKVYTVGAAGLKKFLSNINTAQTFTALNFVPDAPILGDGNFIYVAVGLPGGTTSSSQVTQYIAGVAQAAIYRAGIVKIDVTGNSGQGSVDSTFVPLANAGEAGSINAMAQDADYIYIGGNFAKFGNSTANRMFCKVNKTNGQVASDWSQGTGFNAGVVRSIVVGSNSSLYCSGSFYSFNGTTKPGVAKISKQGALDTNFASPIASNVALVGGAISPVPPTKLIEVNSCLYLGGTQSRTTVFAPIPGKGILKSSGLSTFTLDASFDISTGLSQTGTAGTYMEVSSLYYDGSNLYLGAVCQGSTDVPFFKTVQGPEWTIDKATAAVVAIGGAVQETVATPTFGVAAGTYSTGQIVSMSTTTAGASIYYTVDGSTPTASSSLYSGAVSVSVSKTIKAIAIKSGATNSAVASAIYYIYGTGPNIVAVENDGPTPSISLSWSAVPNATGYTLYYAGGGPTPSLEGANLVLGNVTSTTFTSLTAGEVNGFRLVATGPTFTTGLGTTTLATGYYGTCEPPLVSLASGSYFGTQPVYFTAVTPNSNPYVTLNGVDPDFNAANGSLSYDSMGLGSSLTLKVVAVRSGYRQSSVVSRAYVLTVPGSAITLEKLVFATGEKVMGSVSKDGLAMYPSVVADAAFSDPTTWRWINFVYTNDAGQRRYDGFDARQEVPVGIVRARDAAGSTLSIQKVYIVKADRTRVKINRAELDDPENFDFTIA